jgi:hypothetical protein
MKKAPQYLDFFAPLDPERKKNQLFYIKRWAGRRCAARV